MSQMSEVFDIVLEAVTARAIIGPGKAHLNRLTVMQACYRDTGGRYYFPVSPRITRSHPVF